VISKAYSVFSKYEMRLINRILEMYYGLAWTGSIWLRIGTSGGLF
jgi:hypothetical protein